MNLIRKTILVFSWLFLACFALGVIGIFLLILTIYPTIPRTPESLDAIINLPPTEIFASDGSQIGSIGGRTYVPFERISKYYLNAVISVEDDQFFTHPGVDKPALLKATAGLLLGAGHGAAARLPSNWQRTSFSASGKAHQESSKKSWSHWKSKDGSVKRRSWKPTAMGFRSQRTLTVLRMRLESCSMFMPPT